MWWVWLIRAGLSGIGRTTFIWWLPETNIIKIGGKKKTSDLDILVLKWKCGKTFGPVNFWFEQKYFCIWILYGYSYKRCYVDWFSREYRVLSLKLLFEISVDNEITAEIVNQSDIYFGKIHSNRRFTVVEKMLRF